MSDLKTLKDFRKLQPALLVWDMLKKEAIEWIKKIRLAKEWRCYFFSINNSGDPLFRQRRHKPKTPMGEEEIQSFMGFGHLHDDKPCNWIIKFFNITEKDLK